MHKQRETLFSFKKKDLLEKHREVFSPKNLVVCAIGNYKYEKLKDKILENFEGDNFVPSAPNIQKKISRQVEHRKGIGQARFAFSFYSPQSSTKEDYAMRVLFGIFVGGLGSRVFSVMREKEPLIYEYNGGIFDSPFYSHASFYFGCDKKNVSKIEKILLREFEKVSKNLSQSEMDRTKGGLVGEYKIDLESCFSVGSKLVMGEIEGGNAEEFYNFEEKISAVEPEEVKNLAKGILENGYGTFTLLPK